MNQPQSIHQQNPEPLVCKRCGGTKLYRHGKNPTGSLIYRCTQCYKTVTPNPNINVKQIRVDPQAEYLKDCWDCRALGIKGVGDASYIVNFAPISQDWLKEAGKKHCKVCLSSMTFSSVQQRCYSILKFSRFLASDYYDIEPKDIDREVITNFTLNLKAQGLKWSTRGGIISSVKFFLDDAFMYQWLDVRRYLVRSEDFPKVEKAAPRYIPEEVLEQLFKHIKKFAPPVQRMIIVLFECGMRISELVNLNFDCLLQDNSGSWFLKYYQYKMKKEITIPISRETAKIIKRQQKYIRQHFTKEEFDYLFCGNLGASRPKFNPRPQVMARKTLPRYLNSLAKRYEIRDATGEIWHFQTHQFRHTIGTRMINNGVPQHIVQKYLGHESPQMTATYAHIHDETMKKEISKFQDKVVNVSGQVIKEKTPEVETSDLQWFKRMILAQALPNGSCALPTITQGCPHANACLTCTHFRTTSEHLLEHKHQLQQTRKLLEKAKANGWVRQIEMNEQVKTNLENIIKGLERSD